jgi:hypothetical protein
VIGRFRRVPWSRLAAVVAAAVLSGCGIGDPIEVGPATWAFAPGQEIGPETTEFVAIVTERACASGQSSEDRIAEQQLDFQDGSIIVTFRVRPLEGVQACPGNPPTAVKVDLGGALGDRRLLDGGREPPAEPPVCANRDSCE